MPEVDPSATPPDELDAEFAVYVGRIAAAWSAIEFHVNLCIWTLMNVAPALGACATSQIYSVDGRMKALLALLKLRRAPQKVIDAANKFMSDMRGPQELRNRTVHDTWVWDNLGTGIYQLQVTAPSKLTFEVKRIALTDLDDTHKKINALVDRAAGIKKLVYDALPSLPQIPASELHPITDPLRGR